MTCQKNRPLTRDALTFESCRFDAADNVVVTMTDADGERVTFTTKTATLGEMVTAMVAMVNSEPARIFAGDSHSRAG